VYIDLSFGEFVGTGVGGWSRHSTGFVKFKLSPSPPLASSVATVHATQYGNAVRRDFIQFLLRVDFSGTVAIASYTFFYWTLITNEKFLNSVNEST